MAKLRVLVAAVAIAAGVLPISTPALAQRGASDAERLRRMGECDTIKDETRRLSCYDAAVRSGRASLGAGQQGMLPGMPAAQPRSPQQAFGMTPGLERELGIAAPRSADAEEITAKVVEAADRGAGMWRITLANGARWQFAEGRHDFVPPARGADVRVRRASMGSYLMYVGKQPSVRVVRIQ
ncbi:MAG: hypothetical protein JWL91_1544 [Sphingomonas bacterium]|nr:hypothetical protein [Sphingomonas bacterium]MDB5689668.1 hypothetical protein [Sphingomonas bacterium]